MHLQYSSTTVVITYDVVEQTVKYRDGTTEEYKTVTGKTVAVYSKSSLKKLWILNIKTLIAKKTELYNLWLLINGPEKTLTFRDKDNVDHNVKWIDESFPITKQNNVMAAGVITIEEI